MLGDTYLLYTYHGLYDLYFEAPYALSDIYVPLYAGPPHIDSFSPTSDYVGDTGTITVQGKGLVDPFTYPNYTIQAAFGSGTGLSLQFQSYNPDDGSIVLKYTIDQNATTGPVSITLQDRFGIGTSSEAFTVGDPTPVIDTVSPQPWPVGNPSYTILITGSGFGTNPTLTVSGDYTGLVHLIGSTPTSISAAVSISSMASTGTATVTVQSNGYSSNGNCLTTSCFAPTTLGQLSSVSVSVQVQAVPAGAPRFNAV